MKMSNQIKYGMKYKCRLTENLFLPVVSGKCKVMKLFIVQFNKLYFV